MHNTVPKFSGRMNLLTQSASNLVRSCSTGNCKKQCPPNSAPNRYALLTKNILKILIIFSLFSCNKEKIKDENNYYQNFVDTIINYQAKAKLIDSLNWRDTSFYKFDTTTFKLEEYLKLYDKLKIISGWKPDYYYIYDGMGGAPLIFVMKEKDNLDSLILNFKHPWYDKNIPVCSFLYLYNDSIKITEHLKLDETCESYFQLIMFYEIGCNFYLFWHANYGAQDIICSKNEMEKLLKFHLEGPDNNETENSGNVFFKIKDNLDFIDFIPKIKFEKDSVKMKVIIFAGGKGLYERNYSISRKFPHRIIETGTTILVKDNTKIIY